MQTIPITYTLVGRFKNYHYLQVTRCKKVINVKTGKVLKQCLNGGSIGYWVAPKVFIVCSKLNDNIELIPKKINCPF